ncbi:MAG: hypothetical protein V7638_2477 [Acidobacteriota bacterium]
MKKRESNVVDIGSASRTKLNDEVDELFRLPLAEFTDARNALAKRLKQSGRANDANLVRTLAKPSVSAWTVNQLYWHHREEFAELLAAGQRVRQTQTSGLASKLADMRQALDARREALSELSSVATSLLSDAGHNPSPDTIRRITTTLEAISALSDGPTLGRLTQDVEPPGFESLASFMAGTGTIKPTAKSSRATISAPASSKLQQKAAVAREAERAEEMRQAQIAAAKISLQAAKKSLAEARARAQSLEATQKNANVEAKQAEKQLREAEERLKKASAAAEAAAERAQSVADEVEQATTEVEDAKRAVEKASRDLESWFGDVPAK